LGGFTVSVSAKVVYTTPIVFSNKFHTASMCGDYFFTIADKEVQEAAKKAGMVALKALSIHELINYYERLLKEGTLVRLSCEKTIPFGQVMAHGLQYIKPPEDIQDWMTMFKASMTAPPLLIQKEHKQEGYVCLEMQGVVYQRTVINRNLLKDNTTTTKQKELVTKYIAKGVEGQKIQERCIEQERASIVLAKAAGQDKLDLKEVKADHKAEGKVDKKIPSKILRTIISNNV